MFFVVAVVLSAPRTTHSREQTTEAQAQNARYACGPRAALVLIRMMGQDAIYSTVCNHAPPSEQGCSLEDVQNALLVHDVPCSALRLQLTDLSSLPCPFILHTVPMHMVPMHASPSGGLPVGHYVIVTEVDKVGLHTIDPVTNQKRHWRWISIGDQWGGYAIVPTQASDRNHKILLPYLLGIHLLVAACAVAAFWQKMGLTDLPKGDE